MKTLIMNGGPRKKTHAQMIEALERGLTNAGSEVITKRIYDLDIRPCQACAFCMKNKSMQCAQKDDMTSLYPVVAQSDLLLLVTPVYLDGMTGPMKTFIDRLLPLIEGKIEVRDNRARHPLRKVAKKGKIALLSACGFPEIETFNPLVAHVKAICKNYDREYAGEVLVSGGGHLRRQGDWNKILGMIEVAGSSLVNEGRFPEDLSSQLHSFVSRDKLIKEINAIYSII
jgi:multimeric flavodoxin WrbA